jgi:hypothetical protein
MGFESGSENKQHIRQSDRFWKCFEDDYMSFKFAQESKSKKEFTRNGMINAIIRNLAKQADSSVIRRCAETEKNVVRELKTARVGGKRLSAEEQSMFVSLYVEMEKKRLVRKISESCANAKGRSLKIRLNGDAVDMLEYDCAEDAYYGKKAGKYIKALLEEYASLPYAKREAVIFKDTIDEISKYLPRGNGSDTRIGRVLIVKTAKAVFRVKPYAVMECESPNYNYLVSFSAINGCDDEKLSSIRISRITDVYATDETFGIGCAPNELDEQIKTAIAEKGLPYLIGELSDVSVVFTPFGVETYHTVLQNRPSNIVSVKQIDGTDLTEYVIRCTEEQAKNYFRQFGEHAVVTSPESVRSFLAENARRIASRYDGD